MWMLLISAKVVILLNDWVVQVTEGTVRVWTASIYADSRVGVDAARVDRLLEGEAVAVFRISVLTPDILAHIARQVARFASWEGRHACDLIVGGEC